MPSRPPARRSDQRRRASALAAAGAASAVVVLAARRGAGPDSRRFGVVAAWAPMAALGTATRWGPLLLPARWHRLRGIERSGRLYEALGVRLAKAALRRGPLATFNPKLHLPSEPTRERIAALDRHMCEAEAAHVVLLVATTLAAAVTAWRGDRRAARWMLATNVVVNAYPAMLQRYNRVLLERRYPST